jgi:transposase-like protein
VCGCVRRWNWGVTDQRYRAVLEVLEEGAPLTEVARRYGVARQTVHELRRRLRPPATCSVLHRRWPRRPEAKSPYGPSALQLV